MLFGRIAFEEGWTEEMQIAILLLYINQQDSQEAFSDFLDSQRADPGDDLDAEPVDEFTWGLAKALQEPDLADDAHFQLFCGNVFDLMTIEQAAKLWGMHPATR
jgi:hypothetical protein